MIYPRSVKSQDRTAVVTEMVIAPDGALVSGKICRAVIRNKAQLAYHSLADWLDGKAAAPIAGKEGLDVGHRVKLVSIDIDQASSILCAFRRALFRRARLLAYVGRRAFAEAGRGLSQSALADSQTGEEADWTCA